MPTVFTRWRQPGLLGLLYASTLQVILGVLLLVDPRAVRITTLHIFDVVAHGRTVGAALIAVAALAVWGTFVDQIAGVLMMMPQQAVIVLSAVSAAESIWRSAYGDGVVRPRAFIAADQAHALLLVPVHAAAVVIYHSRRRA